MEEQVLMNPDIAADEYTRIAYTLPNGTVDWRAVRLGTAEDETTIQRLRLQRRNLRQAIRNLQAAYERQRGLALSYKEQLDEQPDHYVPGIIVGFVLATVTAILVAGVCGLLL